MKINLSVVVMLLSSFGPLRSEARAADAVQLENTITADARNRISAVLQRYCPEACELINVDVDAAEVSSDSQELGFEGITDNNLTSTKINRLAVDIQVDDRVSKSDQERLGKLISNSVRSLGPVATVRWSSVIVPQIGVSAEVEDRLKQNLQQRIQSAVQQIIDSYCPSECVLASVTVEGKLASPDEARGLSEKELIRDRAGRGVLRIQNVDIDLSVDEKLPESNRTKIFNLIKAKTRFAYPVNINLAPVDFPETATGSAQKDPWGLDRLRQTLQIFRDLAGTKEIITNSTQNSSSNSTTSHSNRESQSAERVESKEVRESNSLTSKEKLSASEKSLASNTAEKNSELSASEKSQAIDNQNLIYILGFALLLLMGGALFFRFSAASKDAKILMDSMPSSSVAMQQNSHGGELPGLPNGANMGGQASSAFSRESLSTKMKIEFLREELLKIFVENPKVARDTFSRMLKEDGIDQTSKYVHIFGPMIIFDLMNDPSLQRDLNDLSEFYHKSSFLFSDEQSLDLLNGLRTKVTASEIRVMARKRTEQFDFLHNLDATQIFNLISEEKAHIQGIVLTQLDNFRRRSVFDMYTGEPRVALMRELCKADAIPKDYLANVAKALHKKVLSRTEFDTEQLRSSDVIIELLEKASLIDQRRLMADLVNTNPDAARLIKLKLVTVEMLPFIRDGHLLEIVMGLERQELLTFLIGSPEHIRDLLLAKAPAELAQSWVEDIEQSSGIEEGRYRIAEMRILGRVRNLANSGAIRLLDINDRIFAPEHLAEARRGDGELEMPLSASSIAA